MRLSSGAKLFRRINLNNFFAREKTFRSSISRLREDLVRAQALVREANTISSELKKQIEFTVTMRIPSRNLTPNRKVSPVSIRNCHLRKDLKPRYQPDNFLKNSATPCIIHPIEKHAFRRYKGTNVFKNSTFENNTFRLRLKAC